MIKKLCISFAFLFGCAHASPLNQSLPDGTTGCGGIQCSPVYHLNGEVTSDMKDEFVQFLDQANERHPNHIIIEINSPGGSVPAGFQIAKAIENNRIPVVCVVDDEAASMAAYILQSCQIRVMTKRSTIMFHEPAMGGNFNGQPNDWQAIANWLKAMRQAMAEHCIARSTMSMAEYRARTDGGQMMWLAWTEAKHYHFIDFSVTSVRDVIARF